VAAAGTLETGRGRPALTRAVPAQGGRAGGASGWRSRSCSALSMRGGEDPAGVDDQLAALGGNGHDVAATLTRCWQAGRSPGRVWQRLAARIPEGSGSAQLVPLGAAPGPRGGQIQGHSGRCGSRVPGFCEPGRSSAASTRLAGRRTGSAQRLLRPARRRDDRAGRADHWVPGAAGWSRAPRGCSHAGDAPS